MYKKEKFLGNADFFDIVINAPVSSRSMLKKIQINADKLQNMLEFHKRIAKIGLAFAVLKFTISIIDQSFMYKVRPNSEGLI